MAKDGERRGISRRTLLIGGGAGVGLLVAWTFWPRTYSSNLRTAPPFFAPRSKPSQEAVVTGWHLLSGKERGGSDGYPS